MLNPVTESKGVAALVKKAQEIAARKAEEAAVRSGKPFATKVRPKDRPGDPNFVGPVEQIGPRQITPETFIGPGERQGPSLPFRTNVRLKPQPETGTGFTMVDTPGQGFTMSPPSRAMAMRDIGSEAAGSPGTALTTTGSFGRSGPQPRLSDVWDAEFREIPRPSTLGPVSAADDLAFRTVRPQTLSREELLAMRGPEQAAMSAGRPYSGSYLPLFAGSVLGGTALLSGGQQAQEQDRANRFAQIYGTPPQSAGGGRGPVVEQPDARLVAESVGSGRGAPPLSMEKYLEDKANAEASNAALDVARARVAPMPPRRPEELRARPGGLASLFSDPYAGKSARELYVAAQDPSMRDDEYGANLLNIRAARAGRDEGYASGGAATGKSGKMEKDAALHKALDIIAHMLGRH
jgi:hypothetical protein